MVGSRQLESSVVRAAGVEAAALQVAGRLNQGNTAIRRSSCAQLSHLTTLPNNSLQIHYQGFHNCFSRTYLYTPHASPTCHTTTVVLFVVPALTMSFDQLSSMERQPTTMRRSDDPEYQDDPEFNRFTEELSAKLFSLTSNISRLSQQIGLLGTKRDTERVRERVHDLLEEARGGFKEVGEGIKKLTSWEDLNVFLLSIPLPSSRLTR